MNDNELLIFYPSTNEAVDLEPIGSWPASRHRFDRRCNLAVQTAIAARRPLLVRGEPGIGKSQLARAAAQHLGWPFLYHVINARSEHSDLLYYYDAVSRLAQAQVLGQGAAEKKWKEQLAEERFVRPGVLWWAFDWAGARKQTKRWCRDENCDNAGEDVCCASCCEPQHPAEGEEGDDAGWRPGSGCVVLVDEIDKAETDLPNGLLESFANNGFQAPHCRCEVALEDRVAPLLIITTNEERELPAAFVRRCVVLRMGLPKIREERIEFLIRMGRDHCAEWISDALVDGRSVYQRAAEMLLDDREAAVRERSPVKPGLAEYLDMLYVLSRLHPHDAGGQAGELDDIKDFIFTKYIDEEDVS